MGLFKRGAIKQVTRKRVQQILQGIDMYYMKPAKGGIHEGALKKALMDWVEAIEMTSSTFAGLTGGPVKFDMPLEVRTANFKTIFSYIVMVLVEAELSYDKSIGTSQDRELIMETIDREFQK